jgi:ubiquinone/menaquinone biosynthesis C-methylase UbiE
MKHIGLFIVLLGTACRPSFPHASEKEINNSFQPILKFMDYQPGMTFADVGASSGVSTVMMATLMDKSTIYIQDIDTSKLKRKNVEKIIDYYSKQSKIDLRSTNKFQITVGNKEHSNLPEKTFDLIHSNATVHAFDSPDSMLTDLRSKLKPNGMIFIRDSFKNDHGAGNYCSYKKCAKPLITIDEFISLMKKNGFSLVKRSPDVKGYPMFGFKLDEPSTSESSNRN